MRHPGSATDAAPTIALLLGPGTPVPLLPRAAAQAFEHGIAALARQDFAGAARVLADAARLAPTEPACHAALGLAAAHAGDAATANRALRTATTQLTTSATLWRLRADVALSTGATSDAFEALRHLIPLAPTDAEALGNLGAIYREAGEPVLALKALHQALVLAPTDARILSNTALTFHDLGDYAMARQAAAAAVARDPHFEDAKWNLSLMQLLQGDYTGGWSGYEQRAPRRALLTGARRYAQPLWTGAPIAGPLFLWPEQGLGDFMQFLRYLPDALAALGPHGQILLATPAPLRVLVEAVLPPTITVVDDSTAPAVPFAAHASLLSLPFLLGTGDDLRGYRVPYLAPVGPCPDAITRALPPRRAGRRRIGIVWAGQPLHKNDRNRSMPLEALYPLLDRADVDVLSLQKGPAEALLPPLNAERAAAGRPLLTPLGATFRDFNDTAHAIAELDLVITVDTSVAHLAGTMGCPVWLLLPLVPDWRWQIDRADTPWYPQARLFRQRQRGDWAQVIADVAAALDAAPMTVERAA